MEEFIQNILNKFGIGHGLIIYALYKEIPPLYRKIRGTFLTYEIMDKRIYALEILLKEHALFIKNQTEINIRLQTLIEILNNKIATK